MSLELNPGVRICSHALAFQTTDSKRLSKQVQWGPVNCGSEQLHTSGKASLDVRQESDSESGRTTYRATLPSLVFSDLVLRES